MCVLGEGAKAETATGDEVALTALHLEEVFAKAQRLPDGRLRASTSLFLSGKPIGPFTYQGTLGKLPIVLELAQTPEDSGTTTYGSYAYLNKGIDIPLHVTKAKDGNLTLREEIACTATNCPHADDDELAIEQLEHPWVGRGGMKLARAIEHFGIDVRGKICADIGASTGGFTDVILKHGAAKVYVADDLTVVKEEPSVLPDRDSVWLRAPQVAGSWRTTRLALCAEPRSTWTHCGKALLALSQ